MSERDNAESKLLDVACRMYATVDERAAMRGALGDAAALCDALARDIAAENRGYGGKGPVTKQGLALEAVAKRCGDAIWAMRNKIEVPPRAPAIQSVSGDGP